MFKTCETEWSLFSCKNSGLQIPHWFKKGMFTHVQKVLSPNFLMTKRSQGNFVPWDKMLCKIIKGFRSYLKKLPRVVHPSKKIRKRLTRLWRHVVQIKFSSTSISCSCIHGCFVPPILYLIREYFARINHIVFNWEQKFGNKFPGIVSNNALMTTNSCKSTTIL